MMQYLKYSPTSLVSRFVECYFVWEGGVPPGEFLELESPPSGFSSFVFVLGDRYHVSNQKYRDLVVPAQFVAGQSLYSYKLTLSGQVSMAGIVFKPAAISTIFGLDMSQLVEERKDLCEIFQEEVIKAVREALLSSGSAEAKARVLDDLMVKMCALARSEPDHIDDAADLIVAQCGLVKIPDLLKDAPMSRRTFERRFFFKVGLSPKFFATIRRISHICNQIAGKENVDWSMLLYHNDFFDQAHFIKAFESFTGRSPVRYLKGNKELAKLVEKPLTRTL